MEAQGSQAREASLDAQQVKVQLEELDVWIRGKRAELAYCERRRRQVGRDYVRQRWERRIASIEAEIVEHTREVYAACHW